MACYQNHNLLPPGERCAYCGATNSGAGEEVIMEYRVGDVIEYGMFGGGSRIVKVTAREANIKNGRAGFDGDLVRETGGSGLTPGNGVWGYDDQIIRVKERRSNGQDQA